MGSDLVANAAAASDYDPFAITGCRSDPKAGTGASRCITTASAVALANPLTNALTNAATDLWRAG
jgi:hypothetical protein